MTKLTTAIIFVIGLFAVFLFSDDLFPESAEWFGKTGLSTDIEKELPRYLRRELGESIFSSKSLKASDLKYVGAFDEGSEHVHYWRVPWGTDEVYAFARTSNGQTSLGWGNRKPPKVEAR